MKRFQNQQRVRVIGAGSGFADIVGRTGTVVRLRRADNGAWVAMDADLPDAMRSFPADDERANHIILYPDECEAING